MTIDPVESAVVGEGLSSRRIADLERLGLVDSTTGDALVRPNDRLAGLYDLGGLLVQAVRTPPGLYVVQAQPRGFGLGRGRPRRNLLLVTFEARQLAPARVE